MTPTIHIYGQGWVGKAMKELFPYAEYVDSRSSSTSDTIPDAVFICVPSPLLEDGRLDCSIVEDAVKHTKGSLVIIRSTVMPGTCDALESKYGKDIIMQPEYLGESVSHPLMHEAERTFLILGGRPEARRRAIELYMTVYNANTSIRQVSSLEAEVTKLSENRAIAYKVAQCQELYDACEKAGVDYYTVREAVYGDDPRFDLWWTFVFPDNRGFQSSKCLSKDVPAWCAWAESVGASSDITKLLVTKSREYESLRNNPVA